MTKTFTLILLHILLLNNTLAQKKTLSHNDFDKWKSITQSKISNDGNWVAYQINPQKGDGYLYLYNTKSNKLDSIPRGYYASISSSNKYMVFKIKAHADTIRNLTLKKTKKDKMPKDSLGIWIFETGEIIKYPSIKNYNTPKKEGDWVAIHFKKEKTQKKDTLNKDTTTLSKKKPTKPKKKSKFKSKGTKLLFLNPLTGDSLSFESVTQYRVPEFGKSLFIVQSIGDSIEETKIKNLNTADLSIDSIFHKQGKLDEISCDEKANQLGFLFSPDTVKNKTYRLYYWAANKDKPLLIVDTLHQSIPNNWCVNNKGKLFFSEDGSKLFFGTGKRPEEELKDTLTKEEKYHVDIWNWKDLRLQPMQQKNLKKDKNRAYKAVYIPSKNEVTQLENKQLTNTYNIDKGNLNFVIGYDDKPYLRASSWSGEWANDIYKIDILSGDRTLIKKRVSNKFSYSPDGKFFSWFNPSDSIWYIKNIAKGHEYPLTKSINTPFYNELNDIPNPPRAYGIAGWSEKATHVYIYDKYDIWKINTKGKTNPINLTNGRNNQIIYRYINLDKDDKYINDQKGILLKSFNEKNKDSGFSNLANNKITVLTNHAASFNFLKKAKYANKLIWNKGTFKKYPEIYISNTDFKNSKVISNTNPQQKDYKWGNIELVNYTALDGKTYNGLLVTPETIDKNKKYPMIVYYYDRNSDNLHKYYTPRPSRSVINWSTYASNDYVIFIPDIYYRIGDPGLCAYEAITGGVKDMLNKYSFIDKNNIGLQGQSWGGYQTAFMITRTNMFKAAMAGAPVSNMTSAYGGIRWDTGMSRMFQYEHTQSRIGGTLWDKFPKYYENSPIFYVPQIETPLLIMHNDKDGAVPWYQGIELFVAMRRLNKPAWMLTYNNEAHNLKRRANSIDLSIRMMQFFDHYLKGKPAPIWMEKGIPAVKKGLETGYEFVE